MKKIITLIAIFVFTCSLQAQVTQSTTPAKSKSVASNINATFDGYKGDNVISKKTLLLVKKLDVTDSLYTIGSFSFSTTIPSDGVNGKLVELDLPSEEFSPNLLGIIKKTRPGSTITFKNIHATIYKRTLTLPDLVVKVTE